MKRTNQHKKTTNDFDVEYNSPTHSLNEYVGIYENQPFGTATITCRDGRLWLKFYTREHELEHIRFNVFKAKYREDMSFLKKMEYRNYCVKFCLNYNGDIDRLTMPLDSQVDEFVFIKSRASETF